MEGSFKRGAVMRQIVTLHFMPGRGTALYGFLRAWPKRPLRAAEVLAGLATKKEGRR